MKLNPLNNFSYLVSIKPKEYTVFLTNSEGVYKLELASPEDRVFEIEYKENTLRLLNSDNKVVRDFVNNVEESAYELETIIDELIKESLV